MGDDIETDRVQIRELSGLNKPAQLPTLAERQKSKQMDIDDRPEPIPSSINNPAQFGQYYDTADMGEGVSKIKKNCRRCLWMVPEQEDHLWWKTHKIKVVAPQKVSNAKGKCNSIFSLVSHFHENYFERNPHYLRIQVVYSGNLIALIPKLSI